MTKVVSISRPPSVAFSDRGVEKDFGDDREETKGDKVKASTKYNLSQYCEKTTLHGFAYILEPFGIIHRLDRECQYH